MNELDLASFFLNPINLLTTVFFLAVVIIWGYFKSNGMKDISDTRLYRLNMYHKLLFVSVFGAFYLAIFGGGDTYSYWVTAGAVKNLMLYNFDNFWEAVTNEPTMERMYGLFSHQTGYPLRYIYIEEESFFVAKVISFFRLITFDNYFASSFLISFIATNASWNLYKVASKIGIFNKWLMPVFVLFLPSVAFWASGVSKDTIVLVSIFCMIYHLSYLLLEKENVYQRVKRWLFLLFFVFFIYNTRPFILYAMILPLVLMYVTGLINRIRSFAVLKILVQLGVYLITAGAFLFSLTFISADELLQSSDALSEAMLVQQDFENNTTVYGGEEGKRYSLGEIDFSPVGIIQAIPASIVAGIYRPFIWEALSPALFFNGIESLLLIFLTVRFFASKFRVRVDAIRTNELLVFSFGFVLLIAFMAGFTSILFGVLVRIRAPLLPFLGLLLSIDWKAYLSKKQLRLNE